MMQCAMPAALCMLRCPALLLRRLFQQTRTSVVQYTVLLLLFGVASYKSVGLPFLAVTPVTELSTVLLLSDKLMDIGGLPPAGGLRAGLASVCRFAFLAFRAAPHFLIMVLVLLSPGAFANALYYAMALAGMALLNGLNYSKAQELLLGVGGSRGAAASSAKHGGAAAAALTADAKDADAVTATAHKPTVRAVAGDATAEVDVVGRINKRAAAKKHA